MQARTAVQVSACVQYDAETFYYILRSDGDVPMPWQTANPICGLYKNSMYQTVAHLAE